MLLELLVEIYKPVALALHTTLGVVYATLLVLYFARLAIRFINDGTYRVNFFFTDSRRFGWVKTLTFDMNEDTDDPVGAILFGMAVVPVIYAIGILLWPLVLLGVCGYGFLLGARCAARFKKKVEKHIEHLQD